VSAIVDMATMRFITFSLLWLMGVSTARCQNVRPPQFTPYTGPTIAYPESQIGFTLLARSFQTSSIASTIRYELLAAPTNVTLGSVIGRPPDEEFAFLRWQTPSHTAIGTTNVFTIRATDEGIPPLSATNTVSFVLVNLPPIHSISISNGAPTLQFSNPIPVQEYLVLWSADLSATNLSPLCRVVSDATLITVTDTNALIRQRFYRLVAGAGWCYGFCP
jgi:hypothetical protein